MPGLVVSCELHVDLRGIGLALISACCGDIGPLTLHSEVLLSLRKGNGQYFEAGPASGWHIRVLSPLDKT